MTPWMFILNPLEPMLAEYPATFDAWEAGGVRGIVIGRLLFEQDDGSTIRTFASDPGVYDSHGIAPPEPGPRDHRKEKQLHALLDNAAGRGWKIMIFVSLPGAGDRPLAEDPCGAVNYAAGLQDLMNAYPQAHGQITDGPGENHYEPTFHHGGHAFEVRNKWAPRYEAMGFDLERMQRGATHLHNRLHALTPGSVRYHATGGMLAALSLFELNEDTVYWLRAREKFAVSGVKAVRERIDQLSRRIQWGAIPRTAAFASLTGQNYGLMAPHLDYIFPKHYFWHRGFDGMYGTIARWVRTIGDWNPGLNQADCFAVVKALFGIELPGVESLMDMEMGFPEAFFEQVVYQETRRALEAVGDDDKVIAWISTGRSPHAGDAMPAHDLHHILKASARGGLKRFVFHSTFELGVPEWRVICNHSGGTWREDPAGYWPADTQKPDAFGGGWRPTRYHH